MARETVLVVEDEKNIVELLKYNLEKEGYQVVTASRGDTGLAAARKTRPNLLILDLMLPEIDGLEICKILKQDPATQQIPIIMLTAKGEETDKIVGLELGADDYVTKPFSIRELMARIKAVLRRGKSSGGARILKAGRIELDTGKYTVKLDREKIELTSKEFDLLKAMMGADGRVLSRDYLLDHVWGYDNAINIETRTVDMHIGQLRKKLKEESGRIVTVKNAGYRFDLDS